MLNRQKTLLLLLQAAGRPVSKLELTKWAFLVREETTSKGGSTFYDFLPYKFGPFSFCLYREMDALVRDGYAKGDSNWQVTPLGSDVVKSLPKTVQCDVQEVVHRFGKQRTDNVIDYVYSHYPRFTVNSERKKLAKRVVASPAIYTAGYERLSVDAFLDRLILNGIQRIIDVRNNPIARRYGFHRSTLNRLANRLGIDYVHIPELGIESSMRRQLNSSEDYEALFGRYERETLARASALIGQVANLMQEKASVLVCMEADPLCCHRTRLAAAVAKRTGLSILDLGHFGNDETA